MPPSWAGTVGVLTPRPTPPSDAEALLPTRAAGDPYAGSNWEDHRLRVSKVEAYFLVRVESEAVRPTRLTKFLVQRA